MQLSKVGSIESRSKVSIVLPAYNEERDIVSALNEMEKQTYENREIIVVDDGSSDNTLKIVTDYSKTNPQIRVVQSGRGGPAAARNRGIREATGQVIFFGECDCVYDSNYVEKAIDCLTQKPGAAAVCLTGAPLVTKATLATDCLELENAVQHKLLKAGKIKPFYAWVYTKEALDKIGGFDPNLFQAEDKDLFQRMKSAGYEVAWVPGIHWRHRRDETTLQLAKGWIKRGRTRVLYSLKHHSTKELAKSVLPLWLFALGLVLLALLPHLFELGALVVVVSLGAVVLSSLRMLVAAGRSSVHRARIFLFYPVFCLTRSFCFGLGYTIGLFRVALLKLKGKPLTWSNV